MNGLSTLFRVPLAGCAKSMIARMLLSMFLLKPVVGPGYDARSIILCRFYADGMQSGSRVRGAEGNQISIADVFGRIDHALLEPLVASERCVFPAALLRDFLRDVLLEGLYEHFNGGERILAMNVTVVAGVLHIVQKLRSRGRK